MGKIPPRRISSDDYEMVVDGQTVNPHEGEWVEVLGLPSIAELQIVWRYNGLSHRLAEQIGKPGGLLAQSEDLDQTYQAVCEVIGRRVTDWSWTDDYGEPLPKPDGTADPIKGLNGEEVYYVLGVVRGMPRAPKPEEPAPVKSKKK